MNASARPSIHLSIVQPSGYVHSMGLLDAALYFRHQFQQLGADVTVAKNRLRMDAPNLVFGAHLGFDANLARTFCCVFVNLEQLGPGGSRMPPAYLELLRSSHVIDYDAANLGAYARSNSDVPLISFGYAPYLAPAAAELPLDQRPFDLLFFGSMNPRRLQLIERIERTGRTVVLFDAPVYGPERDSFIVQSRAVLNCPHYDSSVFEQVRAFQVLSLGTPLVSERTERTRPASAFEHTVSWFNDETLERFFADEYPQREFAIRAQAQLQAFRNFDPHDAYARALDFARAAYGSVRNLTPAPACPQRLLQISSGRDYRPGWLNIDLQDAAQPDIRVDLSRPQTWPTTFASPFWGQVQLQAGASDLIHANNVVEHVTDLTALMRNCLDLLRVGGALVIEAPYEESLGAWQDPTHVRALNENSWLYYTDWFWYLGWFEHRFKVRDFKWLDENRAPCEKARAAFMAVAMEKTLTTVAERMTARTMRPDFGGLLEPARATASQAIASTAPECAHLPMTKPSGRVAKLPSSTAQPRKRELPPTAYSGTGAGDLAAKVPPMVAANGNRMAEQPAAANYYNGLNLKLLAAIPPGARRVLELGCANGHLGQRYKELNPDSQWWGVDLSHQAAQAAAAQLDRVLTLDLDRDDLSPLGDGFDVVVIGDLLEHLREPDRVLHEIYQRSTPDAKVVCCLPNMSHASVIERLIAGDIVYDDTGLLDRTHARFFSQASAFKTFLDTGWLPSLNDQYRVEPSNSRVTASLLDAAVALGIPRETAQRNLGLYQMIIVCDKWQARPLVNTPDAVPFSVIVAVNRPWQFALNIARSPGLREVQAEVIPVENAPNAAAAFTAGSARAHHAWRLFAHQDVYFPVGSGYALQQQLGTLERAGGLGVPVGMAGLQADSANQGVRFAGLVADRLKMFDHGPSSSAVSIDELAVALHRDTRLQIDPSLGWHLWATDLCLQARRLSGRSLGRILTVPLFHNSASTWSLPEAFRQSADLLLAKYPELAEIPTLCGTLTRRAAHAPAAA